MWNGISFVAKAQFAWGESANFALLAITAALYSIWALAMGRLMHASRGWLTPRGAILLSLAAMAAGCIPIAIWPNEAMLWLAACVASLAAASLWPVVESYVAGGRHGGAMRSALGWWNLSWTIAVPVAMGLMGPLLAAGSAVMAIALLAPVNALALLFLPCLPTRPAPHDPEHAATEMSTEYPHLLRSVRSLLPCSYVLVGALSPLMPYRLADLNVEIGWQTPIVASWMLGRIVVLVLLWRTSFWHGRWGTLLLGSLALFAGFAAVVLGPSLWLLLAGLAAFGVGMGVIYYAAIYYALSVGHAEVDAGGKHEALIGAGYTLGPLLGLLAFSVWEGQAGARGLVIATYLVSIVAVVVSMRAYLAARRARGPGG
jgi:MFS family permease